MKYNLQARYEYLYQHMYKFQIFLMRYLGNQEIFFRTVHLLFENGQLCIVANLYIMSASG